MTQLIPGSNLEIKRGSRAVCEPWRRRIGDTLRRFREDGEALGRLTRPCVGNSSRLPFTALVAGVRTWILVLGINTWQFSLTVTALA